MKNWYYLFAMGLAALACVLCTTQALIKWTEGENMDWLLLLLGIINGILFVIDLYFYGEE